MTPALALFFFTAAAPEQRAVEYLAHEVSRWSRENGCFSCHNNGDAARVLYVAKRTGYDIPPGALDDAASWLRRPTDWLGSRVSPGFNDPTLAPIQFAAALAESGAEGRAALASAAELLVHAQDADGSWRVNTGGAPGAPVTYGTTLATYQARRTLEAAGAERFAGAIARANRWLAAAEPVNILDAAAQLLALPHSAEVRRKCVDRILAAQTTDGGWGPQTGTPAEAFDTAIVLMALSAAPESQRTAAPIARARAFLLAAQLPSGGWPATTRPHGQQSYAEHISTSAWVLDALLLTRSKRQ